LKARLISGLIWAGVLIPGIAEFIVFFGFFAIFLVISLGVVFFLLGICAVISIIERVSEKLKTKR